jgi:hypothetical protein
LAQTFARISPIHPVPMIPTLIFRLVMFIPPQDRLQEDTAAHYARHLRGSST